MLLGVMRFTDFRTPIVVVLIGCSALHVGLFVSLMICRFSAKSDDQKSGWWQRLMMLALANFALMISVFVFAMFASSGDLRVFLILVPVLFIVLWNYHSLQYRSVFCRKCAAPIWQSFRLTEIRYCSKCGSKLVGRRDVHEDLPSKRVAKEPERYEHQTQQAIGEDGDFCLTCARIQLPFAFFSRDIRFCRNCGASLELKPYSNDDSLQ
jgi:hypothetical protein